MILLLLFFLLLPANAATVTNGGTTISNFRNLEFNGSVTLTGNQANGYALIQTTGLDSSDIGTTVQAWDEHLDDIAAITPGAENRIIVADGLGGWSVAAFSSLDTDTTDHTALSNIGTNTHAQIDTHISNANIHFTNTGFVENGSTDTLTNKTIDTASNTITIVEADITDLTHFTPTDLDTDYGAETITSDFDFGGGTLQIPNSTTLPGTCEVGDSYMDTDATSGQRFYLCESANTWALQGDGSSEWTDTGTILHPNESAADEIVIGGTTEAGADIFLGADGSAVFNEQGAGSGLHFRIEGSGQPNLFDVDYSNVGIGIGGAASPSYLLQVSGNTNVVNDLRIAETIYLDAEVDDGNSSTADTIDWGTGNHHKSTMTGNCTYTFTAPGGPTTMTLKLVQDATGSRTATWPASAKWAGGVAPTLTTTASAVDFISCYYDGTNYYCSEGLDFK